MPPREPLWRRSAAVVALSYLAGSIPFSNLMARHRASVDLRDVGTGTVSGTGLYEVTGFGPLAVVGVAEVAKGTVGPLLAGPDRPVLAAVATTAGIAGHDWSIFLQGAGGRGISPSLGALLVRDWPGTAVLAAGLATRIIDQTALGCFVADLALVPVLWRTRGRAGALMGAAVVLPMFAKRLAGNRPPARRDVKTYAARLLLDHDEWGAR